MEPVFYIMAILGCGEADAACREVRMVDQRFETAASCDAATPGRLEEHSDISYPVVVAQCRRADQPASMTLSADEVMLPDAEPQRSRPQRIALRD
jgi:hypothetical protein